MAQDTAALFMTRFEPVLRMALQQKTSRLRQFVDEQTFTGAKQVSPLNLISAVQVPERTGRFQPKDFTTAAYTRRWVAPTDYEKDILVDQFDLLKTTIDPKSEIVQSYVSGFSRAVDDTIIAAATGGAQVGTDAGSLTTESFTVAGSQPNTTSTFQVLGSFGGTATTGMTVAKLNEARRLLEYYQNVDELMAGDATLVIGPQQHADLRNQALVTSSEFNRSQAVLEKGYLTNFMGFNVVVSNRLPIITDAAGNTTMRGCLVFMRSGLKLGVWQDLKTRIFEAPWLSGNPWDINATASFGATRTELGKIIQICAYDPTPAADITQ